MSKDSPLIDPPTPDDITPDPSAKKESIDFLEIDSSMYERAYHVLIFTHDFLEGLSKQIAELRTTATTQDNQHYDFLEYLTQSLLLSDIGSLFNSASNSLPALQQISSNSASENVLRIANNLLIVAIRVSRVFTAVSCSMPSDAISATTNSTHHEIPQTNGEEPVLVLCRICEEYVPIEMIEQHSKNCVIAYESEFNIITTDERIKKLQKAIRNTVLNVPWPGDEAKTTQVVLPMLHDLMLLDVAVSNPPQPPSTLSLIARAISNIKIIGESTTASSLLEKSIELIEEKARASDALSHASEIVNKTRATGGNSKTLPLQTTIAEFEFVKRISSGAYAKVFLTKKKKTGDIYAVKVTPKNSLKQKNEVKRVLTEKDILLRNSNPFIVDFYYSIIGEYNLYLVMEYLPGGDLYSLLQKLGSLDEDSARTYTAQILKALEFLHKAGIIHRDIKPDNILVSASGKLKLTDFGLSLYGAYDRNITETEGEVVGTPDYLAPEILLSRPHSFTVDYWSLGAVIFEFLTGIPPFHRETEAETFSQILLGRADWEELDGLSEDVIDLIHKLLTVEPEKRLGANGIKEIMDHKWFDGIDWDHVDNLPPVFVPELSEDTSTEYFEQRYQFVKGDELEKDILSDIEIAQTTTPQSVSMTDLSSRSSFASASPLYNNSDEEDQDEEDGDIAYFPSIALKSLQNYNALAADVVRHKRSRSEAYCLGEDLRTSALGMSRSFMANPAQPNNNK